MLERFTPRARRSVKDAVDTARSGGAPAVGEEHLLAALLAQPDSTAVALLTRSGLGPDRHAELLVECRGIRRRGGIGREDAEALRGLGIEVDRIIDRVEEVWGENALLEPVPDRPWGRGLRRRAPAAPGRLPWRPEVRHVLEAAVREAQDQRADAIGTAHLLLALLTARGVTRDVLTAHGLTPLALRAQLRPGPGSGPGSGPTEA